MQSFLQTNFPFMAGEVQRTFSWPEFKKDYGLIYKFQTTFNGLLLLATLLFLPALTLMAQPAIQWDKTIGSPGNNFLYSSQPTADGGYILGGLGPFGAGFDKTATGAGKVDYWIVKLSADGVKEWDRTYGGFDNDALVSVRQTADGGYILAGNSYSNAGGDKSEDYRGGGSDGVSHYDYWIVKIAADGTKEWDKTLGGDGYDELYSIDQTADGGYIVGGVSNSGIGVDKTQPQIGLYDFWVVKLAANGSKQWDKTLGRNDFEESCVVRQTADGGYVLGGTSFNRQSANNIDYLVIRLAPNGTPLWQKVFGGTGTEYLTSLEVTKDGGYIVGGYSDTNANGDKSEGSQQVPNSSGGFRDYWVLKLTQDGLKEWDRTLGGNNGSSFLHSLYQTSDEGYILGGYSEANAGRSKSEKSKGGNDFWAVKLDANGKKIWDKTIGGNASDQIRSVSQTRDGGYFLAGFSYSSRSFDKTENKKGSPDFWAVKLAPEQSPLAETPVRINAGGPDFTTATKKLFIADQYYAGIDRTSSIASGDILNTTNDVLYRSGRCSPSFSYNIPVANGTVDVILHFAEIWYGVPGKGTGGAGKRQFNVTMENSRKLTNFDIFAAAGGAMRAVQKSIPVTITDGMLNIDFTSGAADLPRISAIEVIRTSSTLKPLADASVRDGSYNAINYGTAANLDVKSNTSDISARRSSYLRFQLPQVAITSAKLRIYGHNHENSNDISVHAYGIDNDSWTETGIAKNNAPVASTPSLGYVAVNNAYKYYEVDVTSYVKAQQQSGETLVSLLLADPNNRNIRVVFNSKENSSFPPQLIVQTPPVVMSNTRLSQQETSSALKADPEPSSVYPNPVGKQFTVQVSSKHSENISLDLLNSSGQSYQVITAQKAIAGKKVEVNISGLALSSGIYLLKIKSEVATEVIKLLVTD